MLTMMTITCVPLSTTPGPRTPTPDRQSSPENGHYYDDDDFWIFGCDEYFGHPHNHPLQIIMIMTVTIEILLVIKI